MTLAGGCRDPRSAGHLQRAGRLRFPSMQTLIRSILRFRLLLAVGGLGWILSGCAGYEVRGRVVSGSFGGLVAVVDEGDPRLRAEGVGNARITIVRDPGRLNARQVATGVSEADGDFVIPLAEFGAGWLDEEWRVQAVRSRIGLAEGLVRMPRPGAGEVLLIELREADPSEIDDLQRRGGGREDLYDEVERWSTP